MADMGKRFKNAWMKGMEAIGNTASNIAANTRYRVNEMNLENRRHEILQHFGTKAYEIWQTGTETFPEELEKLLRQLAKVDENLNAIRAERAANAKQEATITPVPVKQETEDEQDDLVIDYTSVPTMDEVPVSTQEPDVTPIQDAGDAIDALFESVDTVVSEATKDIDQTIESVAEKLENIENTIDQAANNLAEELEKTQK